mmetsp:Transcript_1041/g.4137  ORF Transcript_1041/g.4137 Transcript_1041/m.4137 type:complete len:356 (+) Transcript_1041:205-1272(+)
MGLRRSGAEDARVEGGVLGDGHPRRRRRRPRLTGSTRGRRRAGRDPGGVARPGLVEEVGLDVLRRERRRREAVAQQRRLLVGALAEGMRRPARRIGETRREGLRDGDGARRVVDRFVRIPVGRLARLENVLLGMPLHAVQRDAVLRFHRRHERRARRVDGRREHVEDAPQRLAFGELRRVEAVVVVVHRQRLGREPLAHLRLGVAAEEVRRRREPRQVERERHVVRVVIGQFAAERLAEPFKAEARAPHGEDLARGLVLLQSVRDGVPRDVGHVGAAAGEQHAVQLVEPPLGRLVGRVVRQRDCARARALDELDVARGDVLLGLAHRLRDDPDDRRVGDRGARGAERDGHADTAQ